MNAFAVSFVLIIISASSMAVLSFLKAKHRKDVLMWGWLCVSVLFWGVGGLMATTTLSYDRAYLGWQIGYIGSIFAPIVFLHFAFAYCQINKKLLLNIGYCAAVFFTIINFFFEKFFFGKLRFTFNEFYSVSWSQESGYIYVIYYILFYWLVLFYAFSYLIKEFVHSQGPKRNQLKYLLLAMASGWTGAHGDFLIKFNYPVYPYSNFLIALYPVIAAYAIIRHHLLDINIIFKKSIIYSLLVTFVTSFYLLLVFLSERFFQGALGYNSNAVSIFAVLLIAILFTPLKDIIQRFVDLRFFKGSLPQMAEENTFLRQEVMDKEKFKAVATMASGMAHEIKNPLTAIKIFSEYLPLKMNDPEFLQKFSRIVGKEADRINDLVRQLLEFSRPSAPKLEETSIQNLIGEVLDFLSSQFINCNIKVEKNFQLNGTLSRIDPNQFRQVFLNLFINAIEAMPKGGTLAIQTEDQRPKTENQNSKPYTLNPKPCIIITITDTGTGIPPETLKTLFEPFHTTKAKGTGLGLSITKNIIESHKGRIKVESNVGRGTKFVVELPILKKSDPVSR